MSAVNRIEPATWVQPVKKKVATNSLQQTAIPIPKSKPEKYIVRRRRRRRRNHNIITESEIHNRPQHDELFDRLIEVARDETSSSSDDDEDDDDGSHDDGDDHDPKTKKAWKKLLKDLEEYFDDEKPVTSCGRLLNRHRQRKFFEQPDTNLFCAIHHAVLHNNLYVIKKLVHNYGCGKNANLACCHSSSQLH